ncbi:hypothetical protein [Turicibacter sanguinis]|uniref:hypothetical protein n=1 Tax=Turicibacter sanguinis TaxID=154288 RepID=UPI00232DD1E8|nr:hypothetical protein [Turicibacter sanguinis]MDB8575375.1 hypothetical protein [Turicibacter sanguinis]MDB8577298.1 hypothetical protein [Turicibacter sanguinis]MDB8584403.1 hypothetical protein [Turicibacter sanguinis]MDB8586834.1 hypothetical protein [Turicibacter sanguinis]MDB8597554.1 hypothetical protein [Turicibacter sanguinis]
MAKYKIDGDTFNLNDEDLEINLDVDKQSGLVEIDISDKKGCNNIMYIKRDVALVMALWLKDRISK